LQASRYRPAPSPPSDPEPLFAVNHLNHFDLARVIEKFNKDSDVRDRIFDRLCDD
jgi:hypothetical protein